MFTQYVTAPLGGIQQLRGPNFTQFWPPPPRMDKYDKLIVDYSKITTLKLFYYFYFIQDCLEKWNAIPDDTDILMTHGPPLGKLGN